MSSPTMQRLAALEVEIARLRNLIALLIERLDALDEHTDSTGAVVPTFETTVTASAPITEIKTTIEFDTEPPPDSGPIMAPAKDPL